MTAAAPKSRCSVNGLYLTKSLVCTRRTPGEPQLAMYRRSWSEHSGAVLSDAEIDLGFRWAALQLPVQHLPWTVAHSDARAVTTALDQIDGALAALR